MRITLLGLLLLALGAPSCADRPNPKDIDRVFAAVDENDSGYVRRWLKAGGDPNAKDRSGQSMLYVATGPHGGDEVLEVLLSAGADPNIGHFGYTPLMNASSWANDEAVALLLRSGADPNLKNESGQTALETTGDAGGSEESVKELIRQAQNAKR